MSKVHKTNPGCLTILYWVLIGWWLVPALWIAKQIKKILVWFFNFIPPKIVSLSGQAGQPLSLGISKIITAFILIFPLCFCFTGMMIYSQTPAGKNAALSRAQTQTANVTPTITNTFAPSITNTPQPTSTPTPTKTHTSTQTATAAPLKDQVYEALLSEFSCLPSTGYSVGQVVNIIDGDTIEAEIEGAVYRIRYIGIDTPETSEEIGETAKQMNAQIVAGKTVILIKDVSETDQYDRLLRYVFVGETFVNYQLVLDGYASPATYPPDVACVERFQEANQAAIEAGAGFWYQDTTPTSAGSSNEQNVVISYIYYDGSDGQNEPDEYVEIRNDSATTVDITGWTLRDAANHTFRFPSFIMQPGQTCRVYTNQIHEEYCGFSFHESGSAIWNNGGDTATLRNSAGELIDQWSY